MIKQNLVDPCTFNRLFYEQVTQTKVLGEDIIFLLGKSGTQDSLILFVKNPLLTTK